jgi:hypothetical protein
MPAIKVWLVMILEKDVRLYFVLPYCFDIAPQDVGINVLYFLFETFPFGIGNVLEKSKGFSQRDRLVVVR